jgi:hypothetical protein
MLRFDNQTLILSIGTKLRFVNVMIDVVEVAGIEPIRDKIDII